jgi:glutathione synthase/RimK-type ligase-like ATP-grasp enzyme
VAWDAPGVDWDAFDLVVVRSTWDYTARLPAFLAWADRVGARLRNPPEVLRWNTDKRYLADLDAAGIPVVPTTFLEPGAPMVLPDGPCVVKPVVSAGSRDTARHDQRRAAAAHAQELLDDGRVVMVQPYVAGVDEAGETALLYVDGAYDHAIRKGPMLLGGRAAVDGLFAPEAIEPREPSAAEHAVAERVAAFVAERFGGPLLYARIDLLPTPHGPLLLELELTEPSLFLEHAPGAAERFAEAIRRRVRAAGSAAPR